MTKGDDGKYSYTIADLPTGEYTVTESNASIKYYSVTTTYSVDGGKTSVKKAETSNVDITNDYSRDKGSLTFTKSITGVSEEAAKNITFTVTGPNFIQEVKLKDMSKTDGKYSYTINDLPTGVYTVKETNAAIDGYNVETTYSVKDGQTTIKKGETSTVEITNKYTRDEGSLTFTKTFSGISKDAVKDITFTVTGNNFSQVVSLSKMTEKDGKYSYTIDHLPTGEYTVTENNASVEGYTVTTNYSVKDGKTTVKKGETSNVDITNEYTRDQGSLTFTKSIAGLDEKEIPDITFTVTGPSDYSKKVKLSEMTKGEDGKYTYTLDQLPTGEYTVTESKAGVDGYTLTTNYSVKDGKTTVKKGETSNVDITNEYTRDQGSLTFTKSISGLDEKEIPEITFTVTGPSDYSKEIKLSEMTKGDDGKYSYTIADLPTGKYTVTENNADVKGYTVVTTYSVESGKTTVKKDQEATIDITNDYTRNLGSLTFTKTINGVSEEDAKNITFTVSGDNFNKTVKLSDMTEKDGKYSYTISDLPTGEYTVTESNASIDGYNVKTSYSVKDGKTTVEKDQEATVEITNDYEKRTYDVEVSKVDAANNKELEGAKLQITDADGKVIDTWTSTKDVHKVKVPFGTYTLTELSAPSGYEIAKPITFTVDKDGTVKVDGKKVDVVLMKDEASKKPEEDSKKTDGTKTGVFTGLSEMTTLTVASLGAIGLLLKKKKEDKE